MIRTMASGNLIADPVNRTSSKGNQYATFALRTGDGDGAALVSGACFVEDGVAEILTLRKGDSLAVVGRGELKSWTSREGAQRHGLGVTVDRVLGLEEPALRKRESNRKAVASTAPRHPELRPASQAYNRERPLDGIRNDLPWEPGLEATGARE